MSMHLPTGTDGFMEMMRESEQRPEFRLSVLMAEKLATYIDPTELAVFINENFRLVSAYSHAIHERDKTPEDALKDE